MFWNKHRQSDSTELSKVARQETSGGLSSHRRNRSSGQLTPREIRQLRKASQIRRDRNG